MALHAWHWLSTGLLSFSKFRFFYYSFMSHLLLICPTFTSGSICIIPYSGSSPVAVCLMKLQYQYVDVEVELSVLCSVSYPHALNQTYSPWALFPGHPVDIFHFAPPLWTCYQKKYIFSSLVLCFSCPGKMVVFNFSLFLLFPLP